MLSLEDRARTVEALGREEGGQQSVHRSLAGMERLTHAAVDALESGRLRARRTESARGGLGRQIQQPGRGRGGTEVSNGARDVPPRLVVGGAGGESNPDLGFKPGDERGDRFGTVNLIALRQDPSRPATQARSRAPWCALG